MSPERRYDILVVGGGPAGLAAACAAASGGQRIGVVDDNPSWGGQIWRGEAHHPGNSVAQRWFAKAVQSGVDFLPGTRVVAQPHPNTLWAETDRDQVVLSYERLILATGARERFLPFPGWTLPGVLGAGGLQALVKTGLPIAGQRVVVAGSGPLLLAVAAYLHQKGAKIALIAEQTSWQRLAWFALGLTAYPSKFVQALGLKMKLLRVPFRIDCWPVAAQGKERLTAVTLANGRKTWEVPCEYLACGFGLTPNVELPVLLGCALQSGVVRVDDWQHTTVPGVYCAGETTGIGGLECSLVEGQIAGHAAAGQRHLAQRWFRQRHQARRFAAALATAFALRPELRQLPQPDTIVCRCEDVSWSQLTPYTSWRAAKLQTRCGMGPCQGRICGPALAFLRDFACESVRPPVFPVRVESLL